MSAGWRARRRSATCDCSPGAGRPEPSSTTPTARRVTELSLRRSREAYRPGRVPAARCCGRLRPSTRRRRSSGSPPRLPLVFAPTGFTRMMHTEGEPAVARVAARVGIPYALSTMGTTSIERLATEAPDGREWFQLYLWRDRAGEPGLRRAGPGGGLRGARAHRRHPGRRARLRDVRNGLTIPPSLSLQDLRRRRAAPALVVRPDHHRAAGVRVAQPLRRHRRRAGRPDVRPGRDDRRPRLAALDLGRARWSSRASRPSTTRGRSSTPAPTRVIVSNHGGRQLDRAPTPLEVLPAVVDAVGDRAEVYVDGGILSGSDVVAAVALGRACRPGRARVPLRPDGRRRARACSGPPRSSRDEVAEHPRAARRHARVDLRPRSRTAAHRR